MSVEDYANRIRQQLGEWWLPEIYAARVLTQRTRAFVLGNLKFGTKVSIQHTLLGVELKVGRRRIMCPDLATARYLSVFARAGCGEVAVPYDITKVSQLADQLESSWYRMLTLSEHLTTERSSRLRARVFNALINDQREQIVELGAGPAVPQFIQNTKQRKYRS